VKIVYSDRYDFDLGAHVFPMRKYALLRARLAEREPSVPVDFIGLDGEHLPLDDNSMDNALSTWTLCTIPDVALALREIRRVLKPGGRLYFIEHGLSPDPEVARRQHRLNRLQNKVAGGCNLDRDISSLVTASGLEAEEVSNFYIEGPKFMGYMYAGTAKKLAAG